MTAFTLKSKTHRFGMALGIFGGLVSFMPTVREFISPEIYGNLMIGFGVAVVVLRNVTDTAISDK